MLQNDDRGNEDFNSPFHPITVQGCRGSGAYLKQHRTGEHPGRDASGLNIPSYINLPLTGSTESSEELLTGAIELSGLISPRPGSVTRILADTLFQAAARNKNSLPVPGAAFKESQKRDYSPSGLTRLPEPMEGKAQVFFNFILFFFPQIGDRMTAGHRNFCGLEREMERRIERWREMERQKDG